MSNSAGADTNVTGQGESAEVALACALLALADGAPEQFDEAKHLRRLAEYADRLTAAAASGVMLRDTRGGMQAVTSSTLKAEPLTLAEVRGSKGPGVEACRDGSPVQASSTAALRRWPQLAEVAFRQGFRTMAAIPLVADNQTLGALTLFRGNQDPFTAEELFIAKALTDMAAIRLRQERALRELRTQCGRLQHALDSRISIEQAKGVVAVQAAVSVGEAFELIRHYARSTSQKLADITEDLVTGRKTAADLTIRGGQK
jgi:transcriptional regulator with GAF, ATPase, and Fis domain